MATHRKSPVPMQKATVLIIEDEEDIQELIVHGLAKAGFTLQTASNGREGFVLAVDYHPDLIVLDWMMPEMNGIETLRRLRRDPRTAHIPVIMLSAKAEVDNKSEGLDAGADDYLAKPFSPKELVSRVNAVLRRSGTQNKDARQQVRQLVLEPESHVVTVEGKSVGLGPTEFRLLHFFMRHPDRVYSRSQLLDQVWGNAVYVDERTVDVHIRRLRKALEENDHDKLIQTVHGVGYRFSEKQ